MCEICDNQGLVIRALALYSDGTSADPSRVEEGGGVDTHVYLIVLRLDQPALLGLLLVDIVYEAICMHVRHET